MRYLGIDPGKSGGLACLDERGVVLWTQKMPETEADLLDVIDSARRGADARAVVERVNAGAFGGPNRKMGVVSAFSFGFGYGQVLMALQASSIPFDLVLPAKWQSAMGCRTGGDKNVSKRRAQQSFPSQKVTHATADALLLAEYCRRMALGLPT